jgi:CHAT domain-containing protein
MGCNTGRAKISPTNDLLGLTTAFHLAGAGTIISTLWRIDRRDCLEFSKAFYSELLERAHNDSPEVVTMDLAQAFRKAVLDVRKDKDGKFRKPYHWAGFTLHGAWLFPRFTFEESAQE